MKLKSREIKFRAWDKASKKMVYSNENALVIPPFWKSSDYSILFRNKNTNHYVHGFSGNLMQCTGLKDKNGKEIYEGDVVKKEAIKWIIDKDIIEEVRWAAWSYVLGKRGGCFDSISARSFEVIGNIYENPKFLK